MHNVRRDLFDAEVQRIWERRSTAIDGVGDALFLLFARDFAPLAERLDSMAAGWRPSPRSSSERGRRAACHRCGCGRRLELETAGELPSLFDEIVAAGEGVPPTAEQRRLERRRTRPRRRSADYADWLEESLADGTTTGRSAASATTSSSRLRGFDGLTPTRSWRSARSSSP